MASNLIKLIDDILTGFNEDLQLITPIIDTSVIDTAEGVWLDALSDVVGARVREKDISNNYKVSDEEQRVRIKVQIELNNGGSTIGSILKAIRYYLYLDEDNTWEEVKFLDINYEVLNANILFEVTAPNLPYINEVVKFTHGGVGFYLLVMTNNPFIVSSDEGVTIPDIGGGLSSIYDTDVGGELSYLVTKK